MLIDQRHGYLEIKTVENLQNWWNLMIGTRYIYPVETFIDLSYLLSNDFTKSRFQWWHFPVQEWETGHGLRKDWKKRIKNNHKFYKLYIRSGDEQTKSKYNRYKNMLRVCIREAEKKILSESIWRHKVVFIKPLEKYWPHFKPLEEKKLNNTNKLVINGHSISDSKDISEYMNNFFCNIGNDLQSVIPNTRDQYKHFVSERVERTFFLSPIYTSELLRQIKSLNPKKACGADGIGAKIILLCPDVFANNLTTIFNKELEIVEYPTLLKIAKVVPLYKKGQKYQANSYRPISLLSSFNKIFEKI